MRKFYVSGVIDCGEEYKRVSDGEAEFWTVYERESDGTDQAIFDCGTREHAGLAAERMNELVERNAELIHAIQFAANPLLWCEREDNVFQYRGKVWFADVLKDALMKVKS